MSSAAAQWSSLAFIFVNCIVSVIAAFKIEHYGRRKLLIGKNVLFIHKSINIYAQINKQIIFLKLK